MRDVNAVSARRASRKKIVCDIARDPPGRSDHVSVRLLATVLLCTACGRFGFEARLISDDAATTDAATVDCWAAWKTGAPRFSAPAPIAELALPEKQGNPWLAQDGKTLYFDSGTGDTEIFSATRANRGAAFDAPVQVTELTSANEETGLMLSDDGSVGVISSSRPGSQGFDLYEVRRSMTGTFDAPDAAPMANLTTGANEFDPFLSGDGLTLYYAQNTSLGQVLLTTSRQTRGEAFRLPQQLMGSGTFAVEADPDLSPDQLVMVFSAGTPLQLFGALRSSSDLAFGTPFSLTDLVSTGHDGDPAFSPDGCELFWISDRGGNRDLYHVDLVP
jgi:hypothetical protein